MHKYKEGGMSCLGPLYFRGEICLGAFGILKYLTPAPQSVKISTLDFFHILAIFLFEKLKKGHLGFANCDYRLIACSSTKTKMKTKAFACSFLYVLKQTCDE